MRIIGNKPLPIEFFLFIKYYKCVYLVIGILALYELSSCHILEIFRSFFLLKIAITQQLLSDTEFYLRFVRSVVYTTTHEKVKLRVFQKCVE